ncbi:MAG: hypothetical protein ABGX82_03240 [Pseudomonas sp.]|uniref:hypothetical protein n=1 Tax=Pseudomonas sp. TaxID=306 RepID=UPI003241BF6C
MMDGLNWIWLHAATLAGIGTLLALLITLTVWIRLLRHRARPFQISAADVHPSLLPGDWTTYIRIRNRSDQPLTIQRIEIWGPRRHYLRNQNGELIEGRNLPVVLSVFSQDSATLAPGATFSTSNHDLDHDTAGELFASANQLGVITDRGDYALALPRLQVHKITAAGPDFQLETGNRWMHQFNRVRVWAAGKTQQPALRRWLLGMSE